MTPVPVQDIHSGSLWLADPTTLCTLPLVPEYVASAHQIYDGPPVLLGTFVGVLKQGDHAYVHVYGLWRLSLIRPVLN
jgi:hypothetical protein